MADNLPPFLFHRCRCFETNILRIKHLELRLMLLLAGLLLLAILRMCFCELNTFQYFSSNQNVNHRAALLQRDAKIPEILSDCCPHLRRRSQSCSAHALIPPTHFSQNKTAQYGFPNQLFCRAAQRASSPLRSQLEGQWPSRTARAAAHGSCGRC